MLSQAPDKQRTRTCGIGPKPLVGEPHITGTYDLILSISAPRALLCCHALVPETDSLTHFCVALRVCCLGMGRVVQVGGKSHPKVARQYSHCWAQSRNVFHRSFSLPLCPRNLHRRLSVLSPS